MSTEKLPKKLGKNEIVLREHEFDGIQEFDQKLPNWWLFSFYGAIVFYIGYWFIYYSTDLLPTEVESINARMAVIETAKKKELEAMMDKLDDSVLLTWSQEDSITKEGEDVYKQFCIACHGATLEGGIGRSLVDAEWAHGSQPMDILNIVLDGTPADSQGYNGQKMTPWKDALGPEKCAKVTAYLISQNPHIEK
ncbi:c-type cytochrome [Verrucomicrobiaceae bacterium R5-34]|nr:c-type cytochrome [Verrucomicrobiaceae bacterium R5-34]